MKMVQLIAILFWLLNNFETAQIFRFEVIHIFQNISRKSKSVLK